MSAVVKLVKDAVPAASTPTVEYLDTRRFREFKRFSHRAQRIARLVMQGLSDREVIEAMREARVWVGVADVSRVRAKIVRSLIDFNSIVPRMGEEQRRNFYITALAYIEADC